MWDDSRHVSRQVPGIGSLLADRLAAAGIDQLRKLQQADPRRIETLTQRHYPFGQHTINSDNHNDNSVYSMHIQQSHR